MFLPERAMDGRSLSGLMKMTDLTPYRRLEAIHRIWQQFSKNAQAQGMGGRCRRMAAEMRRIRRLPTTWRAKEQVVRGQGF